MNDELQAKLNESGAELIDWLRGVAEKGGEFVAEQAPLLAEEIVAWHFWSSVFMAVVLLLGAAFVFCVSAVIWFKARRVFWDDYGPEPVLILPFIVVSLLLVFAASNCYEAVKASVAPRIVLIEYAGQAMGGNK